MQMKASWSLPMSGRPIGLAASGSVLFVANGEGEVEVIVPAERRVAHRAVVHAEGTLAVSLSPCGRWLATGGMDGWVRVLETRALACGMCEGERTRFRGWVEHVAWTPRGELVAAGGKRIAVLRAGAEVLHGELADAAFGLAVSPVPWWPVAAVATGRGLTLVSLADPSRQEIHELGTILRSVAVHPAGTVVVGGGQHGTLHLLRVADRRVSMLSGYPRVPRELAFSPDGRALATSGMDHVVVWELPDGSCDGASAELRSTGSVPVTHVAWLDGTARSELVALTANGAAFVGDRPSTFALVREPPVALCIAGSSLFVASASEVARAIL